MVQRQSMKGKGNASAPLVAPILLLTLVLIQTRAESNNATLDEFVHMYVPGASKAPNYRQSFYTACSPPSHQSSYSDTLSILWSAPTLALHVKVYWYLGYTSNDTGTKYSVHAVVQLVQSLARPDGP